jgi:hypothetical protein
VPLGDDKFSAIELTFFRIKFDRNEAGKVIGIIGIYDDGHTDYTPRDGVQAATN